MTDHRPAPHASAAAPTSAPPRSDAPDRRDFLRRGGVGVVAAVAAGAVMGAPPPSAQSNAVKMSPIADPATEPKQDLPDPNLPPDERIGYAVVGLGRLTLEQILPALSRCKYSKLSALVSGDRDKAMKVARQYGVPPTAIHAYEEFEKLADNPQVQVVFIVLPNSMHKEFTLRAAAIGKHVLCEKPMANSVADCEAMIAACAAAGRKLMIAYRSQYEPLDRALVKMVQEGKLGKIREFVAGNSQNSVDPEHWRFKKALAGGGALPDIGVYCLNAARFLTGEEPTEAIASVYQPSDDPRFTEVEQSVQFILRFPSGFNATCVSSYASHKSQFFRLQGDKGWAEMNPGFAYNGLRLRHGALVDGEEATTERSIEPNNQFAREIDHMSLCVINDVKPHTPGEEGLQDQRVVEAIYESARTGRPVKIAPPAGPTRGPAPEAEKF
jgi:predicted dehydrogenase